MGTGNVSASRPSAGGGKEYHLHTKPGDLAARVLLVGAPERARMIGRRLLKNTRSHAFHRGLQSLTGTWNGVPVSVVTTGMGAPSTGIVLPEAYRCGARAFIRVGSSSTLLEKPVPGDVIIVNAAVRYEGASRNWAPIEFPAFADHRVVASLMRAARKRARGKHYLGLEATTDDFNEGQDRDVNGPVPEWIQANYRELIRLGVACYSMEAAALFVWCATHFGGIPCGAINAVFGNRRTNVFGKGGEELAALIALDAITNKSFPV